MESESNPRGAIQEVLATLGWPTSALHTRQQSQSGPPHDVEMGLTVPGLGIDWTASASGQRLRDAERGACKLLLERLRTERPDLAVDWDQIRCDAQAGDALLKLAHYAAPGSSTPEARSKSLQSSESDSVLARLFFQLRGSEPWLRTFGPGLGEKLCATLVEATVWRRHREEVLHDGADRVLAELRQGIRMGTTAPGAEDVTDLRSPDSAWRLSLEDLIGARPTASNPMGRAQVRQSLRARLLGLGFEVTEHTTGERPPVLVCFRPGVGPVLGLAGHYDIEEEGEHWSLPAFALTEREGRLYGRGTADNLGPLCLRLAVLETRNAPAPPLLWVLQGEEETGSTAAHALYPTLDLPDVALWIEETGYFELDGTQRLLARDLDPHGTKVMEAVIAVAEADGRAVAIHDRHLNKAFGQDRCPFLTHLAKGRPYLAIGPNDPRSAIHAPDESLPLGNIEVSARQFDALLTAAAS